MMAPVGQQSSTDDVDGVRALAEMVSGPAISRQLAEDLDLDGVFSSLDRCRTGFGRAVLYYKLRRTDHSSGELANFNNQVEALRRNLALKSRVDTHLRPIGRKRGYRFWALCREGSLRLPRWIWIGNVASLGTVLAAFAAVRDPAWLGLALATVLCNFLARYLLAPYLVSLSEPLRDLGLAVNAALDLSDDKELSGLQQADLSDLRARSIGRWASWLGRDPLGRSDIASSLQEYFNMLLWLDVVASWQIARLLHGKHASLFALGQWVGQTDAAVAIAECRAAARTWTSPVFSEAAVSLTIKGAYHPRLARPVANDLSLALPGVVISGGNMTGKSTWLRTIGINVVLAQTIATAFASSYVGPRLTVGSSVVTSDSLDKAVSHFEQAVLSVLQALPKVSSSWSLLLLDEPFSGTNDEDRTAATIALLVYLERYCPQCLTLLTTHDPLVNEFGCPPYGAVHFGTDQGMARDYHLRPGRALQPNAVDALRLLDAPPEFVDLVLTYRRETALRPTCPPSARPK